MTAHHRLTIQMTAHPTICQCGPTHLDAELTVSTCRILLSNAVAGFRIATEALARPQHGLRNWIPVPALQTRADVELASVGVGTLILAAYEVDIPVLLAERYPAVRAWLFRSAFTSGDPSALRPVQYEYGSPNHAAPTQYAAPASAAPAEQIGELR